jgi:predicted  nucleic acid-binding Zn-ribbon protein
MMHFGDDTEVHDLARENETLRAEIERLTAALDFMEKRAFRREEQFDELRAEVERLKALLAEAAEVIGNDVGPYGDKLGERIARALEGK